MTVILVLDDFLCFLVNFLTPELFFLQRKDDKSKASLFKTPVTQTTQVFVPSVTSTANIKTNFSAMKTPGKVNSPKNVTMSVPSKPSSAKKEKENKVNRKSFGLEEYRKSVGAGASSRKSVGNTAAKNRKSLGSVQNRKSLGTSMMEDKKSISFAAGEKKREFLTFVSSNKNQLV